MGNLTNIRSFFVIILLACLYLVGTSSSHSLTANSINQASPTQTADSVSCLHKNGVQKIYKSFSDQDKFWSFHFICQEGEKYADIIMRDNGQMLPPYLPRDGTLQSITTWITAKPQAVGVSSQDLPEPVVSALGKLEIQNLPK